MATLDQITTAVAEHLTAHPPQPGRPPTSTEIDAAVATYLAANPPADGRNGTGGTGFHLVKAVGGNSLLTVRSGDESGRPVWSGTLLRGSRQVFGTGKRLWIYIGSPENVRMRLNGRAVVVGGSKPRSLIVTSGNIVPAGPGT